MVQAVRGAICVEMDDSEHIKRAVKKLLSAIMDNNELIEDRLISVFFSQTNDITEANPASALREMGFNDVPLFCTQEPEYKGSLGRVIRVMLTFNTEKKQAIIPVYLDGAEKLRTDLFSV
jgi:chorismate mutase